MRRADSRSVLENWLVDVTCIRVVGEKFEGQSMLGGKEIGPAV